MVPVCIDKSASFCNLQYVKDCTYDEQPAKFYELSKTAYEATHGFSDQYIVEVAVFNRAIERAGLRLNNEHYYQFPNTDLTTVTINLIS